jgi:hypothetical protein
MELIEAMQNVERAFRYFAGEVLPWVFGVTVLIILALLLAEGFTKRSK